MTDYQQFAAQDDDANLDPLGSGGSQDTDFLFGRGSSSISTPAAPTGLEIVSVNKNAITLGWEDNSSDETGFRVERSTNGTTWSLAGTTSASAVGYTDSGLSYETLYYYRVCAYNDGGNSSYTGTVSDTTGAESAPVEWDNSWDKYMGKASNPVSSWDDSYGDDNWSPLYVESEPTTGGYICTYPQFTTGSTLTSAGRLSRSSSSGYWTIAGYYVGEFWVAVNISASVGDVIWWTSGGTYYAFMKVSSTPAFMSISGHDDTDSPITIPYSVKKVAASAVSDDQEIVNL